MARLFGILWILTGLILCSFFTATFTSALTSSSLNQRSSLLGVKVGIATFPPILIKLLHHSSTYIAYRKLMVQRVVHLGVLLREIMYMFQLKWISGQNDFKLVWLVFPLFYSRYHKNKTKENTNQTNLNSLKNNQSLWNAGLWLWNKAPWLHLDTNIKKSLVFLKKSKNINSLQWNPELFFVIFNFTFFF